MKDRISLVIKERKITKTEFAKRLNVSQAFVSQMCSGAARPSDRTISDICREFNVNPDWLRTGDGPMFMPTPEEDTAYINDLLSEFDNPFFETIKAILRTYAESSPEDQKALKAFAQHFTQKMQKEDRD